MPRTSLGGPLRDPGAGATLTDGILKVGATQFTLALPQGKEKIDMLAGQRLAGYAPEQAAQLGSQVGLDAAAHTWRRHPVYALIHGFDSRRTGRVNEVWTRRVKQKLTAALTLRSRLFPCSLAMAAMSVP